VQKTITIALLFTSFNSFALIGGKDVLESDPISKSVVALQMVEKESSGNINRYKGSGVLVTPNIILTASHNFIFLDEVTSSEAIFSITPRWGEDPQGEKRIAIKKVIFYPGFSMGPLGTVNDIALVFLSEPAPLNYVPLKIELEGNNAPSSSEKGILVGYGKSSEFPNTPLSDFRLRKLELNFARWDNTTIFDSQKIWFSNNVGSIAGGDSGGPVLFRKNNNEYVVYGIGIHQRYDECVKENTCEAQSAYSNTSYFADWLKRSIEEVK
jgi:secreted trypsin-like serine protease